MAHISCRPYVTCRLKYKKYVISGVLYRFKSNLDVIYHEFDKNDVFKSKTIDFDKFIVYYLYLNRCHPKFFDGGVGCVSAKQQWLAQTTGSLFILSSPPV